jgi:transposase-like protein
MKYDIIQEYENRKYRYHCKACDSHFQNYPGLHETISTHKPNVARYIKTLKNKYNEFMKIAEPTSKSLLLISKLEKELKYIESIYPEKKYSWMWNENSDSE